MRKGIWLLVTASLMLPVAACGGGDELKSGGSSSSGDKSKPSITVGSANFPENVLLGEIYAGRADGQEVQRLEEAQHRRPRRGLLGPRAGRPDGRAGVHRLAAGYVSKGKGTGKDAADQVNQLKSSLPAKLTLLEPSAAEDKDTVTCNKETVAKFNLKSIEDLEVLWPRRSSWAARPSSQSRDGFGLKGLKRLYGVEFKQFRPLDVAGPLSVAALKDNKVNCANLFSTQSAIPANGFITLEDPKRPRPGRGGRAADRQVRGDARGRRRSSTTSAPSSRPRTSWSIVKRVEVDKDDASTVADDFLSKNGLK